MLSTNCHPPADHLHDNCFNVTAQNTKRKPEDIVTQTKEVVLEYQGVEYLLGRGGELRIDGVLVSPISVIPPSGVNFLFNGNDMVRRVRCIFFATLAYKYYLIFETIFEYHLYNYY